MSNDRTSRSISQRVEIGAHKRGTQFQKLMWWASGVALLFTCVGAYVSQAFIGDRIYQAGPLSTPHKGLENNCAACHNEWKPLDRLLSFESKQEEHFTAVDDAKCMQCHTAYAHKVAWKYDDTASHAIVRVGHDATVTGAVQKHATPNCASCHSEHHGDKDLASVANALCVKCHQDEGPSHHFDLGITALDPDASYPHPDFGVHTIRNLEAGAFDPKSAHGVFGRMRFITEDNRIDGVHFVNSREGRDKFEAGWQDASQLKFNHKIHLTPRKNANGATSIDEHGNGTALSCAACHEPTEDKTKFKPINFEAHCERCHRMPIGVFDVDLAQTSPEAAQTSVPHGRLDAVRGFLIDFYRKQNPDSTLADLGKQADDVNQELAGQVIRPDGSRPLTPQAACGYCHVIDRRDSGTWNIKGTENPSKTLIPERWLPHSRFDHDPHRMMHCEDCHNGTSSSQVTGDILLPTIETCRRCHSDQAELRQPPGVKYTVQRARTNCIECHGYHQLHGGSQANNYVKGTP